jgi:hypothetical protein
LSELGLDPLRIGFQPAMSKHTLNARRIGIRSGTKHALNGRWSELENVFGRVTGCNTHNKE